mmetsp:Transcript_100668/g.197591  ORF Transcript_100668/g.197591 Transcript_100668/m.197591 type:complete len:215 (-) Transcript_100668:29-673(-)
MRLPARIGRHAPTRTVSAATLSPHWGDPQARTREAVGWMDAKGSRSVARAFRPHPQAWRPAAPGRTLRRIRSGVPGRAEPRPPCRLQRQRRAAAWRCVCVHVWGWWCVRILGEKPSECAPRARVCTSGGHCSVCPRHGAASSASCASIYAGPGGASSRLCAHAEPCRATPKACCSARLATCECCFPGRRATPKASCLARLDSCEGCFSGPDTSP